MHSLHYCARNYHLLRPALSPFIAAVYTPTSVVGAADGTLLIVRRAQLPAGAGGHAVARAVSSLTSTHAPSFPAPFMQADAQSARIRRVNASGWFTVAAGPLPSVSFYAYGWAGDGLQATDNAVRLNYPLGLASDLATGAFWIFDCASPGRCAASGSSMRGTVPPHGPAAARALCATAYPSRVAASSNHTPFCYSCSQFNLIPRALCEFDQRHHHHLW